MVAVEKPTTANSPWPITMGWLHPSPLLSLTQFPITPVLTHSSLLAGYIYYLSASSYCLPAAVATASWEPCPRVSAELWLCVSEVSEVHDGICCLLLVICDDCNLTCLQWWTVTEYIYLSTVLKYRFWGFVLYLSIRFLWYLLLLLEYISKTNIFTLTRVNF